MPKIITTARGERIDLDVFKIKSALAQAPQSVAVETRKNFIDKQEQPAGRKPAVTDFTPTPEAVKAVEDLKTMSKVEGDKDDFQDKEAPVKKK